MNLKKIDLEQDYDTICQWWKDHNHWIIPESALSNIGLMVLNDKNEPIAASWLYVMSGCSLGQIGWTVSNPKCGLKERYRGINYLLDGLIEMSHHYKRDQLIILSVSKGLSKMLKRRNFTSRVPHDMFVGLLGE